MFDVLIRADDNSEEIQNMPEGEMADYLEPLLTDLISGSLGCQMFLTANAYVGMAHDASNVQKGDSICVFLGGPTPFLIRRESDHYILLGPCYVHELMNGEAIEDLEVGKYELKDFDLK